jgi:hypothetical protein
MVYYGFIPIDLSSIYQKECIQIHIMTIYHSKKSKANYRIYTKLVNMQVLKLYTRISIEHEKLLKKLIDHKFKFYKR